MKKKTFTLFLILNILFVFTGCQNEKKTDLSSEKNGVEYYKKG